MTERGGLGVFGRHSGESLQKIQISKMLKKFFKASWPK
jgi:hypothetical protein